MGAGCGDCIIKVAKDITDIFKLHFPQELSGAVIDGIDIQMLASDSVRIIDYFSKHHELSAIQLKVLKENQKDLQVVLPLLDKLFVEYFKTDK